MLDVAGCDDVGCSGTALAAEDGKLKALGASGFGVDSAGLSSFLVKKLNPPPAEFDDWVLSGAFEASD